MESSTVGMEGGVLIDIWPVFGEGMDMALGIREGGNRIPVAGGSLIGDGN